MSRLRPYLDAGGQSLNRGNDAATMIIADDSGVFSGFGAFVTRTPYINNAGDVAFIATHDAGGVSVIRSDGITTTTIADLDDGFSNIAGDTSINDAGNVAFGATPDAGGASINVGAGGAITTIADTNGVLFSSFPSGRRSATCRCRRLSGVPRDFNIWPVRSNPPADQ